MITAKEAKALYDESGAEVVAYLKDVVEPAVKKAAGAGKRECFIHVGAIETFMTPIATALSLSVIGELKRLGYTASFNRHGAPYVPRGLQDDNGDGPEHKNYGIHIGW